MRGCTRDTPLPSLLLYISLVVLVLICPASAAYNTKRSPYSPPARSLTSLLPRQTTCSDTAGSSSCGVGNFCCPSDTRCIPVENNTSVVCCRLGEFCDEIFPISCSSTALGSNSVQCGTQCCPAGYDCGGGGSTCVMKEENLPADHIANRELKETETVEAKKKQCIEFLGLLSDLDVNTEEKYRKFTYEGILVGLFPGIAIGVVIMLLYIKGVELNSRRRRTIMFNGGRVSAGPEDPIEKPPKPPTKEDLRIAYSPASTAMSSPPFQRDWKPRTLADYSPDLGPIIAPRESRDRTLADGLGTPPLRPPRPLVSSPLRPPPVYTSQDGSRRESASTLANNPDTPSDVSSAPTVMQIIQETFGEPPPKKPFAYSPRRRAADAKSCITDRDADDDEDDGAYEFSEVMTINGIRGGGGRRSTRRKSYETGYTMSLYQASEVPPLNIGRASPGPYDAESVYTYQQPPEVPPLGYRTNSLLVPGRAGEVGFGRF